MAELVITDGARNPELQAFAQDCESGNLNMNQAKA
jgi:hypothetical protein